MTVTIMMGVPGSGKTTWVEKERPEAIVCSADKYFTDPENGNYVFDPRKLGAAHRSCMRKFLKTLYGQPEMSIVVDNTNTKVREIAPYIVAAEAYCRRVEVFYMLVDPRTASERCIHNVPFGTICTMQERMTKTLYEWPSHWPKYRMVRQ